MAGLFLLLALCSIWLTVIAALLHDIKLTLKGIDRKLGQSKWREQ